MHACAIATLGEFCAGLTLARHLGFGRYRFILAELSVQYHRQGRSDLTGVASLTTEQIARVKEDLQHQEKLLFPHSTIITDAKGETVAEVRTVWQIKSWEKVRLR
jgi:acyl-coenzyme A thioesterase PaaI-like protein